MNKRQKKVLQAQLNNEEEVIARLKSTYEQALGDCESKIQELSMRADLEPENIQSIIYQKQYQEAIKAQLEGALANLQSNSYATVSDYLTRSYQEGYLGALYDMQGQGIPIVIPIDQEDVTRAVMLDSKLSTSLYNRMGEDVKILKKAVQQEVSRGIAQGMTWSNIASNLARNMKHTPFQKAYSNSIRIARTEGHRIQNKAALDAQKRAKDRGANVVKLWDAVLDGKTRPEHRELDGQIREVGEMFEAAGYKVEAPSMFGVASQDCNCRCQLYQKAKWLLDCGIDKMDNFTKEIVSFESPEEYEEWKKAYWSDENIAYMNYVTDMEKKYGKNFETVLNSMTDKEYEKYKRLLDDNPMYKTEKPLVGYHGPDKDKTDDFTDKYIKVAGEVSYLEQTTKITEKNHDSDYGIVDRTLVNSKQFHDKFEGLTGSKKVNESMYQEVMTMLEHRDGTIYEDMSIIDARTGKVFMNINDRNETGKLSITADEYRSISAYKGELMIVHNHPNGSRPSYSDILKLKENNITAVVSAGHDGSVYIVSNLNPNFDIEKFWKEAYNDFKQIYKDDTLARHYATDVLYDMNVFKVEGR